MTNPLENHKLVPRGESDNSDVAYALYEGNYENLLRAIPDAPTEALREVVEAASILRTNARVIPDPGMGGAADCWAVPLDDVDNLAKALSRLEAAVGGPKCNVCQDTGKISHPITMESRGPEADAERARWAKDHPVPCPACKGGLAQGDKGNG